MTWLLSCTALNKSPTYLTDRHDTLENVEGTSRFNSGLDVFRFVVLQVRRTGYLSDMSKRRPARSLSRRPPTHVVVKGTKIYGPYTQVDAETVRTSLNATGSGVANVRPLTRLSPAQALADFKTAVTKRNAL